MFLPNLSNVKQHKINLLTIVFENRDN